MTDRDEKQYAHDLVDSLPADRVASVVYFIESMLLRASRDDEPMTQEERRALTESEDWFRDRRGKGIPMKEVLADFGLSTSDFPVSKNKGGTPD